MTRPWIANLTGQRVLEASPCHFVGLSTGGFVGMRLAIDYPDLLSSLVLMETSANPELSIPTLIIVGEEDIATPPKEGRKTQEKIPGSQLLVIPAAGHSSTIEQSEAINRALMDFVLGTLSNSVATRG